MPKRKIAVAVSGVFWTVGMAVLLINASSVKALCASCAMLLASLVIGGAAISKE